MQDFGHGTILTTMAGANLPSLILYLVEGMELLSKDSKVTIIRYSEEVAVDDPLSLQKTLIPITQTE